MPPASPRRPTVCAQPGCPQLTTNGPRCPTHATPAQHANRNRPNAATRGYNAKWQKERKRYLLAHPQCQWPGCTAPATDVDHADGQGPLGPHGYDWDNYVGYCHPHHSTKTATCDGGFGNPPRPLPAILQPGQPPDPPTPAAPPNNPADTPGVPPPGRPAR